MPRFYHFHVRINGSSGLSTTSVDGLQDFGGAVTPESLAEFRKVLAAEFSVSSEQIEITSLTKV